MRTQEANNATPQSVDSEAGTRSMMPPQGVGLEASTGSPVGQGMLLARGYGSGPAPTGSDFPTFMFHINRLEQVAIREGLNRDQRISAFRRIWYGGIQWNAVIPGATLNGIPQPWWEGSNGTSMRYLDDNQNITIGGKPVDMGHLFAGLDARRHRSGITAGAGRLDDNLGFATWLGDLASVGAEYFHQNGVSGGIDHRTFLEQNRGALETRFNQFFGEADLNSDADAHAINFVDGLTIHQLLYNYYNVSRNGQGRTRRFHTFAARTGLVNNDLTPNRERANEMSGPLRNAMMMYAVGEIAKRNVGWVPTLTQFERFGAREPHTSRRMDPQNDQAINNIIFGIMRIFLDRVIAGMREER
jgi:hypothetical protein